MTLTVFALLYAATLWHAICSHRAYLQRGRYLDLIARYTTLKDEQAMYASFRPVRFQQHVWALFFFKNPADLYGAPLRKLLRRAA